ncbi:MAG: Cof-type HAD-IIB family hydrolase [Clostridiales bacterium]|nr:Cof-type HAD-IIB family hydrolase [Clostridiales bacterium]
MLHYRLVVTDLDGTLLDGDAKITETAKEQIRNFQEAGGVFTIATGRNEESTRDFAGQIGVSAPVIAYNGAKVVDLASGAVLYEAALDPEMAAQSYIALRKLKKNAIVFQNNLPHVGEVNEVILKYLQRARSEIKVIENAEDVRGIIDRTTKKILVIDPLREFDLILGAIRPIFKDRLSYVFSDLEFFEIMPHGASKGNGLKAVARHLGIPIAETVAVGDYNNDVSMIEAAGVGVAVRNADRDALAAARYVTDANCEDGVPNLLRRIVAGERLVSR